MTGRILRNFAGAAAVLALAGCNSPSQSPGFGGPLFSLLGSETDEIGAAALAETGVVTHGAGSVEIVCDAGKLGQVIDQVPEKGRATYKLHDSNPGSKTQRVFHVTGFSDGCARSFTAALAMFGSVELYEMVHFSGLVDAPDAETDATYAKLRRPACGTGKAPCTGNGLKTMARETAFLQAFPRKGSSSHTELLLHKGDLVATSQK